MARLYLSTAFTPLDNAKLSKTFYAPPRNTIAFSHLLHLH